MVRRLSILVAVIFAAFSVGEAWASVKEERLRPARKCPEANARVVREIGLPRMYHEGLFLDGRRIWIANGRGGRIWVADIASGDIVSVINPIASFTEAVDRQPDGTYLVTDWNTMKLYCGRLEGTELLADGQVSFAPEHPAGVADADGRIFVITWHRSVFGTKFYLNELSRDLKLKRRLRIMRIQEPAHLAWDGRYLWMTSWCEDRVYRIDIDRMEATAFFRSPAELTTGIAWDGETFWVTGTYSSLYQVELVPGANSIGKVSPGGEN